MNRVLWKEVTEDPKLVWKIDLILKIINYLQLILICNIWQLLFIIDFLVDPCEKDAIKDLASISKWIYV